MGGFNLNIRKSVVFTVNLLILCFIIHESIEECTEHADDHSQYSWSTKKVKLYCRNASRSDVIRNINNYEASMNQSIASDRVSTSLRARNSVLHYIEIVNSSVNFDRTLINEISKIVWGSVHSLTLHNTSLTLSTGQFEVVPEMQLQKIIIRNSKIDTVPSGTFQIRDFTHKFTYIEISNCQINVVEDDSIKIFVRNDSIGASYYHIGVHLNLSNNNLQEIPHFTQKLIFGRNTFDLSNNNISCIKPFSVLEYCSEIRLINNPIKILTTGSFANIYCFNVYIKSTQVVEIEAGFLSNSHIMNLHMANNNITVLRNNLSKKRSHVGQINFYNCNISTIEENAFGQWHSYYKRKTINLSKNYFPTFNMSVFGNISVSILYLSNCKIQTINTKALNGTKIHVEIAELDLSDNNISDVENFSSGVKSLTVLNLAGNALTNFSFTHFDNLTHLNLSNNRIQFIDTETLSKGNSLISLDLTKNYIQKIDISNADKLSYLNLVNNRIHFASFPQSLLGLDASSNAFLHLQSGMFVGLGKTTSLILARNSIKNISGTAFEHLENLLTLDLAENDLESFETGTFVPLSNLRTLNLSKNRLSTFDLVTFHALKKLRSLDLSSNRLKSLQSELFKSYFPLLHEVKIEKNIINCDKLLYILLHFKNSKINYNAITPNYEVENVHGIECEYEKQEDSLTGNMSNIIVKEISQKLQNDAEVNRHYFDDMKKFVQLQHSDSISVPQNKEDLDTKCYSKAATVLLSIMFAIVSLTGILYLTKICVNKYKRKRMKLEPSFEFDESRVNLATAGH